MYVVLRIGKPKDVDHESPVSDRHTVVLGVFTTRKRAVEVCNRATERWTCEVYKVRVGKDYVSDSLTQRVYRHGGLGGYGGLNTRDYYWPEDSTLKLSSVEEFAYRLLDGDPEALDLWTDVIARGG